MGRASLPLFQIINIDQDSDQGGSRAAKDIAAQGAALFNFWLFCGLSGLL